MPHINRRRPNTRLQIVQLAAKHFVEDGYGKTSLSGLAKELDLSTGNLTFYFPTKEHLLAVLVNELFDFQNILMDHAAEEGKSSLLAYCLELTSITAACEESDVVRDFYSASYTSSMTLELIRANDTQKTKEVFSEYQPDWTEREWVATENIVSGIEYATIMTREENTPLTLQIEKTLDTILYLYGVPREIRAQKIRKVLDMDYRALGRRVLCEFREYIERVNEEAIESSMKNALEKKHVKG